MCVWFCHWLFVAFCSTVRRGGQVFELHISFNMKRWRRVICGRCRHKSTQTTLSQSICLTSSARHYWREGEKKAKRKSIGQWPPWKSCCYTDTCRFHMCATLLIHKGGKKQEGIQRRRLESQGKACLATTSHNKRLLQCFSASFTCVIACFSNCWKYDSKIEMSLSPLNWAWIGGVKLAITVRGPLKAKRPLVDVLSEAMSYLLRVFSTPVPEQWAQEEHFMAAQFKMQSACRYRMLEKYLNNFKYICFLYRLQ